MKKGGISRLCYIWEGSYEEKKKASVGGQSVPSYGGIADCVRTGSRTGNTGDIGARNGAGTL